MRFKQSDLPADLKVRIIHFRGDDGQGCPWGTLVKIERPSTGELVASGTSTCNPKDNPSRRIGREIAMGRALKNYFTRFPKGAAA